MTALNKAYIAHIIADSPDGPRGDPILSPKLARGLSNLMLMCDTHHRLIDREAVSEHPAERLQAMKFEHEQRIEILSSIAPDFKTHLLLYQANIGSNPASDLSWTKASSAVAKEGRYPDAQTATEVSMKNSMMCDRDAHFWEMERTNLASHMADVDRKLKLENIKHISLFAIAPQPLLIDLGVHLSDITDVDVYQLHREPKTWEWQEDVELQQYKLIEPIDATGLAVLNLSLSADIDNSRIHEAIGENISIWTLTVDNSHNDMLRSKEQLSEFRKTLRQLFNKIKLAHGQDATLHIFPAVPAAIAVEVGRVWMPKSDMAMMIYDQIRDIGFREVFEIL